MTTEITRKEKLLSVRNSWQAADWWLVHGRLYNAERTAFYRFKFVLQVDLSVDLWDEEAEEEIPYKKALEEMAWAFCDYMWNVSYDDKRKIKAFIDECNSTIERWNAA